MKNRLLVLLIVLALSMVSGLGLASADGGAQLKALTDGAVTLYDAPDGEAVGELDAYSEVSVLATDASGAWFEVDGGFVMASDVLLLNLPLLAPKVYVASEDGSALFGTPNLGENFLMALDPGTVGTVLTTKGQMAYVDTAYGKGWSVASQWAAIPEGAYQAIVSLGGNDEMGLFAEAMIGSDLNATVENGGVVWVMGEAEGEWVEVMAGDGAMGYALASNFAMLPMVYVDAAAGGSSNPALYDAPDFGANVLGAVDDGTMFVYVGAADEFWTEVYHPMFGMAYILNQNIGPMYYTATVGQAGSIVRAGPNDNTYNAVAQLPANTTVIVKGKTDNGAWIQVALPFDVVTYPYNGVEGWMRDFLFVDDLGNSDLDVDMLNVTG